MEITVTDIEDAEPSEEEYVYPIYWTEIAWFKKTIYKVYILLHQNVWNRALGPFIYHLLTPEIENNFV